jgi:hypothetical protein
MPALVAGIHVLKIVQIQRRGWYRKSGLPDFRIILGRKSGKPDLR